MKLNNKGINGPAPVAGPAAPTLVADRVRCVDHPLYELLIRTPPKDWQDDMAETVKTQASPGSFAARLLPRVHLP